MSRVSRVYRGKSFTERNPVWLGIACSAVVALLLLVALDSARLPIVGGGRTGSAQFSEAGGLNSGDRVQYAGLVVGKVDSVALTGQHVTVSFTLTNSDVHLGDRTSARIVTMDVLGKKALDIQPAGTGQLPGNRIPLAHTTAPYDITDALSTLTDKTSSLDVGELVHAMDSISATFSHTPTALRTALRGVGQVSATISSRDDELQALLANTRVVTGVLAARNREVDLLLGDGSALLAELNRRHDAVVALLADATAVSSQMSGLVADQRHRLGPALTQLNDVVGLLNRNKTNIEQVIARVGPYATTLGEALGSGPFFDAYVVNLTSPLSLPIYPSILSGLGGK